MGLNRWLCLKQILVQSAWKQNTFCSQIQSRGVQPGEKEDIVRNRDISGRSRQSEGEDAGRSQDGQTKLPSEETHCVLLGTGSGGQCEEGGRCGRTSVATDRVTVYVTVNIVQYPNWILEAYSFATEPLSFSQNAMLSAIQLMSDIRIHETATIAKRPSQHCHRRSLQKTKMAPRS